MFDMGFIATCAVSSAGAGSGRCSSPPTPGVSPSSRRRSESRRVEIIPQGTGRTVEGHQRVYFVNAASKRALLSHLLSDGA